MKKQYHRAKLETDGIVIKPLFLASSLMASALVWAEDQSLTIWIGSNQSATGLETLATTFTSDTGLQVQVEQKTHLVSDYQKAAANGEGPDLVFHNHEYIADWAKAGLIAPVAPAQKTLKNTQDIWAAVSYEQKIYGYPYAVTGTALIYNKQLINDIPDNFDELLFKNNGIGDAEQALMWDYSNPYFSHSLFAAEGGYTFAQTAQGWDNQNNGLGSEGTLKGISKLKTWLDLGAISRFTDYNVMNQAFIDGKTASVINGYWSWARYQQEGLDIGIAPFPNVENNPGVSLISVAMAAINSRSKLKSKAAQFVEFYLLTAKGQALLNKEQPIGMPTNLAYQEELAKSDANLAIAFEQWRKGQLIPNSTAMFVYWNQAANTLKQVLFQQQEPKEALTKASQRINQIIADLAKP